MMKNWILWSASGIAAGLMISCGGDDEAGPAAAEAKPGVAPPEIEGMVWIPAGKFMMGSYSGMPNEAPVHEVELDGFYIDETEVTNRQFRAFVDATGYVTDAEQPMPEDQRQYLAPELRDVENVPFGSLIFKRTEGPVPLTNMQAWWAIEPYANWRQPDGPLSSVQGRDENPVVCVTWDDAQAYAKWAGKRLPTEAEWEYAARGGLEGKKYEWGNAPLPGERSSKPEDWPCNIWQGNFPYEDWGTDGFAGLAPVKSYQPNGYGLHDMTGNVWELVQDGFDPGYYAQSPPKNPAGPEKINRDQAGNAQYVMRGGSWRIHRSYGPAPQQGGQPVLEYRVAIRNQASSDSATNDVGFRCVKAPE